MGPRPQLVRDMIFMSSKQRKRHTVLPGLTGLAQVNGRNNITWEEKFRWDLQYIRHISFRVDIVIVIKTIGKVLKKDDVNTSGMETAEDFGEYLLRKKQITDEEFDKRVNKVDKILSDLDRK